VADDHFGSGLKIPTLPATGDGKPVTRDAMGFVKAGDRGRNNAQCVSCWKWGKNNKRCATLQPDDVVKARDSCVNYEPGTPQATVEPNGAWTKITAGFVSHEVRCGQCREFDDRDYDNTHCDLYAQLNRILPLKFDLDKHVDEYDCCNFQTPGERNPANFGPYGPIPDADDEGKPGGLINTVIRNG
jgi:hypothetical protein